MVGGEAMAKDAIFAVKEAENKAQQLLNEARDTSINLREDSIVKGNQEFNRIMEEGRVEAQNIKQAATEEGEALANPILDEGQRKAEDLSNLDPKKIDKAVNFIIERIVKDKWL